MKFKNVKKLHVTFQKIDLGNFILKQIQKIRSTSKQNSVIILT